MDRFINIKERLQKVARRNSKKIKFGGLVNPAKQQSREPIAANIQQAVAPQTASSAPVSPVERGDLPAFTRSEVVRPVTVDSGDSQDSRGDFTPQTDDGGVLIRHDFQKGVELPHSLEIEAELEQSSYQPAEGEDIESHNDTTNPGPPRPLTEEEKQAKRNMKYIEVYDEVPADYTEGPTRLVLADDGIFDEAVALLLSYDFSLLVREVLRAQRAYNKADRMTTEEIAAAMNFEVTIECEIASHESRICHLEEDGGAEDFMASLQEELLTLQAMLRNSETHRKSINNRLAAHARNLQLLNGQLTTQLEEAYLFATLVEPAEEDEDVDVPLPEIDLQEAYAEYRARQAKQNGDEYNSVAPLDIRPDHLRAPPLSPEEQAKQDLRDTYHTANRRLEHARFAFDSRKDDRAYEEYVRTQALQRGEEVEDVDVEAFDKRWFIRIHELTKEVLDAEAAVRNAKTALLDANVEVPSNDLLSGFGDPGSNGYPMQDEEAMIKSAPRPKIAQWLDALPEKVATPMSNKFAGDEWDNESRSVFIDDSASAVPDDSAQKSKIAKWRRMCGLD